jgi:hypothetical protein
MGANVGRRRGTARVGIAPRSFFAPPPDFRPEIAVLVPRPFPAMRVRPGMERACTMDKDRIGTASFAACAMR